jgi:hypothetical protein
MVALATAKGDGGPQTRRERLRELASLPASITFEGWLNVV